MLISKLADCIVVRRMKVDVYGLSYSNVRRISDRNLQVVFWVDTNDEKEK